MKSMLLKLIFKLLFLTLSKIHDTVAELVNWIPLGETWQEDVCQKHNESMKVLQAEPDGYL